MLRGSLPLWLVVLFSFVLAWTVDGRAAEKGDGGVQGAISGTVTEAVTGAPLAMIGIQVWDRIGALRASGLTDASGKFLVGGLAPGRYFATTKNSSGYLDGLYADLPCPRGAFRGCVPADGTPIEVSADSTIPGIDFALDREGVISGTVVDELDGEPVPSVRVQVWDVDGFYVTADTTDASGVYAVGGLPTGTYFATAQHRIYAGEVYDDLPCVRDGPPGCDPTRGTPIEVVMGSTISGIDFALVQLGSITGTVTDELTGLPIRSEVLFWDADGSFASDAETDESGRYASKGLAPGTYFATVRSFSGHVSEIWDDVPCTGGPALGCDPTAGTPIELELNTVASGIDFALAFGGSIAGTITHELTGRPLEYIDVRVWNEAGDFAASTLGDDLGAYTVTSLFPGTYFVAAAASSGLFVSELYDDLPCSGVGFTGCDPTRGVPVRVEAGSTTSGIDFALSGAPCVPEAAALCLNRGRFEVRVRWRDHTGQEGSATAVRLTADSGYFWFFNADNVELVVKVLDACELEGFHSFWVFAAGLTDVEVTLRVTDTATGEVRDYVSSLGTPFQPVLDTQGFATCR